jgi:ABC-type multidrug transport system fused ATPase/permease subunit
MTSKKEASVSLSRIVADLFRGRERWLLAGVFGMSVLSAVLETLGVAAVVPFMSLVLDATALDKYPLFMSTARSFGVTTPRGALLLLGGVTVGLVAIGNAVAGLNLWVQLRFAARTETRLASALFAGYLAQPYGFHTRRDAPSLMKVILSDVNTAMNAVLVPVMVAISRGLMAVGVVSLLFLKDPAAASFVMLVLVASYWAVFQIVRVWQHRLGIIHNDASLERQRASQEGLGGVKELKVLGRERETAERFEVATAKATRARASNSTAAQLPRYVLEAVAFGGILLVTLALVARGTGSAQALVPSLALYAFAGYRLLPAVQQVFGAALTVRFSYPMFLELYNDYVQVVEPKRLAPHSALSPDKLPFANAIAFENVVFHYDTALQPSLNEINVVIRRNESIGLVGRTGAGKSTLADMILGLYEPTSGEITIDGVALSTATRRRWQMRVGYVPQHVFLANSSVAENIALGLPRSSIDRTAVLHAARLAQAEDFINALPEAFETTVGERGVRLSGGQRQRIGIARALYHDPDVLVFDEATSALDGLTEVAVMDAIRSLSASRTIILIAHRLRTVEACDRIIMLDQGRIVADGPYTELLESSSQFRRFVGRANQPQADAPSGIAGA